MDFIDQSVMAGLNRWAGLSPGFDSLVRLLSDWHFFRAAPLVTFLWWAWFRDRDPDTRGAILRGLVMVGAATMASKALQLVLPVHIRPFVLAGELGLRLPANIATNWGQGSCFPSDTATLHFALAMVISRISRSWGMAALAWVVTIIALPRVYLLYHWPSDVVGSAVLVLAIAWILERNALLQRVAQRGTALAETAPQVFYPLFFLALYQCVDSFDAIDFTFRQVRQTIQLVSH